MTDKLTTASVLAFERKLDPSDAVFHAGRWDDRAQSHAWQPVTVRAKSVRGTISNRLKAKDQDPAKLDAAIENPNLQTVDVAALPAEADTLKVQFTLRVLGGAGTPSACNSAAYQAKLLATVQGYVQQHGFGELARRYAANLANGRFLWRNRAGAEQVEVTVEQMQNGQAAHTWSFDVLALNTRAVGAINTEAKDLDELGEAMAAGLAMLKQLNINREIFSTINKKTEYLHIGLQEALSLANVKFTINRIGSMISVHFDAEPVVDFQTAAKGDNATFKKFFHGLLQEGIYIAPSAYETWFITDALTYEDLDVTIQAIDKVSKTF